MARRTVAGKRAPINKIDRIFYVYALYRENGEPFYIGKGVRDRWLHHEKQAQRGRSYKDNLIISMREKGTPITKKKLATNLTHRQACKIEISLIKKFGRYPHGPLTNVTRGGDGSTPGESRPDLSIALKKRAFTWADKLLAINQSPEKRKKLSERTSLTLWFKDGTTSYRVMPGEQIELGWVRGRIMNHVSTKGRIGITDGVSNRLIWPNEPIPNGWRLGETQNHTKPRAPYDHPMKGRIRINDGTRNDFIEPDQPIPEGWQRGHLQPNNPTKGSKRITNGTENRLLQIGEELPEGWRYGATQKHGPRSKRGPYRKTAN
jgi:hypothetical protein